MATNFSSIPILDYSLLGSPETRPEFVSQLLNALTNVGFFYLSNTPISKSDLIEKVVSYAPRFFDLPDEEKEPFRQLLREKREADLRGARKLAKSVGQDVKHVSDKIHSMVLNLFA